MKMLWGVRHANTKDKDEYTWAQNNSNECRTHSWTRGSSVASGSLRPFGPVSGSNVARGLSVLYLTRGG